MREQRPGRRGEQREGVGGSAAAKWVSTPTTSSYCSDTVGSETMELIAVTPRIGDVVIGVGPGQSSRGRPVMGHDPQPQVGQASNQAITVNDRSTSPPAQHGQIPAKAPWRGQAIHESHTARSTTPTLP